MTDVHVFWEPGGLGVESVVKLARAHNVKQVIFSPPAVIGPTRKSSSMYKVQRLMLRSSMLYPAARIAAATFYGKAGELRSFWRLGVAGLAQYRKIEHPDNAGLVQAIQNSGAGIFRWHWLDSTALSAKPLRDETEYLDDARVVGIKIHPYWHVLTPEHIERALQLAKSTSLPLYVHMGFRNLSETVETFSKYPEVPIILACGGFPYFDRLWRKIRKMEHVCLDLASRHIDITGILEAARVVGDRRCLFATDAPYSLTGANPVMAYGEFVSRVRTAFPDPASFGRVSCLNAIKYIPRIADNSSCITEKSIKSGS